MNLVFDKWDDNNNPIPNLYDLNSKFGAGSITDLLFLYEMDKNIFNVKTYNLSEINKDVSYFYVIAHTYQYSFFINKSTLCLSEDIKYHITNNNLKIVFIASHESPEHLDIFVDLLKKLISENGWKEENFYIISNNSMAPFLQKEYNTKINFYKINSLLKLISSNIKIIPTKNDIIYDKKFIFLLQNRQAHEHRILLLSYLKKLNLLENDFINWSLLIKHIDYLRGDRNYSTINLLKNINTKYININDKTLIKIYNEMIDTKKLDYYEQNVNWFDNIGDYNQLEHLTLKAYQNSYINIVSETNFKYKKNDIHISEKSFKPFYYFQIPIFFATYNHVKMIREEYDFDLFDDLIDHSYDDEIDDVKRFHMVVNEIKRLSNMRNEIKKYYKDNIHRILHNHYFVKNYPNLKIDENYFNNL